MDNRNMFSPPRREKARDDSHLPKGDCRYILLHPEVSGQRCACVGFALNLSIPGSTCDCGHQACYHTPEKETQPVARQELEYLIRKVKFLEDQLDRERHGGRGGMVDRIGYLEETVERTKAESDVEIRNIHRRNKGMWESLVVVNKNIRTCEDQIESVADDVHHHKSRIEELDDATMRLEDRLEMLERVHHDRPFTRRRKASTPPSVIIMSPGSPRTSEASHSVFSVETRVPQRFLSREDNATVQKFRERVASVGSGSQSWTVHISLLPSSGQPFPFEKDTVAYKRCLSRGLHQIIVIPDTDSDSFTTAVNVAFADVLRGRVWEPLNAQICNAPSLCGLPMLRRLDQHLIGMDYNADFLRLNCAVCDDAGKILDLYIAMSDDTISWADLKALNPYKDGLEEAWVHDAILDGPERENSQDIVDGTLQRRARPAAGDIVPSWSSSLKRAASEISRTPSFGSTADTEAARAKLRKVAALELLALPQEAA